MMTNSQVAHADQLQVQPSGPADFSSLVEQVAPAVVSVRVKTDMDEASASDQDDDDQGGGNGGGGNGGGSNALPFPDLPENSPFNEFFRRFGQQHGQGNGQGGGDHQNSPRQHHFGMAQGSGFFISDDGFIVTNNHVVQGGKEFTVVTNDKRELTAKLIGTDERTDLALLKVEGTGFKFVKLSQSQPKVGQWVVAVGNPFGLGGTVTAGIVSAEGRDIGAGPYDDFLQIDAPVNRGNSGGPTFNMQGEVIGVNTAIYSPSGGSVGIAFAIPASTVQQVVSSLKENGTVTRGWIGVQIQPVNKDIADSLGLKGTDGALVAEPQDGSPAAKAGIKAGDVITKVNGTTVAGPRELARMIAGYRPDTDVKLTYVRDGKEQDVTVHLGKLGNQQASADQNDNDVQPDSLSGLGLTLAPSKDGDGVQVSGVDDGSSASEKGLRVGDVITAVNGKPVNNVRSVETAITDAKKSGRRAVLMQIQSNRGSRFVALPLSADKG
ncbi:Do family serine endopeptidase [Faunimonas pinastri]|nr:Do family serine endopeptidase [Faunimonas pinastri]